MIIDFKENFRVIEIKTKTRDSSVHFSLAFLRVNIRVWVRFGISFRVTIYCKFSLDLGQN